MFFSNKYVHFLSLSFAPLALSLLLLSASSPVSFKHLMPFIQMNNITNHMCTRCSRARRARAREKQRAAAAAACAAYKCGRLCHVNQFVFFALFRSFLSFHFISFMRHRQFIIFHWMETMERVCGDTHKKLRLLISPPTPASLEVKWRFCVHWIKTTLYTKCKEIPSSQHMYIECWVRVFPSV